MKRLILLWLALAATLMLRADELSFAIDSSASPVTVDVTATPSHTFTCDLTAYQADIRVDADSSKITSAHFSFQFADLDTHIKSRDSKMLKWMNTDKHPSAEFTLKNFHEKNGEMIAKGTFEMHGVAREIEIPCHYSVSKNTMNLSGSATLNTEDYGLPIIKLLMFKVDPSLTVNFELNGTLKPAES